VYLGSAITGAGVDALVGGITTLLPAAPSTPGPAAGTDHNRLDRREYLLRVVRRTGAAAGQRD
jgi:ribosomal protection tetracycline resistance protein